MINYVPLLKHLYTSALSLLFPPLCIHCGECTLEGFLCTCCLNQFEFLNPHNRCLYCFEGREELKNKICPECRRMGAVLNGCTAVFDYFGPAATLVKKMKYGGQPYLAKGAASFMVAQFVKLNRQFPDWIIPVPIPFMRKMERGYNQSLLLAKAFGAMINRPVYSCLKRESNPYQRAGLTRKQRKEQLGEIHFVGDSKKLQGKDLLLIDDVFTTGGTFQLCAEALWEAFPNKIEGLVLCRGL